MSPQEKNNTQGLLKYLSITQAEIEEKFERLEREEKQLRQSEGCFVNHPVAHARNRWTTVMPFANNRVHLRNASYNYINASPINIGSLKFIATQNPTSIYDFWRMTWDENINSITMLMPVNGNGEDRCARYYPRDSSVTIKIGDFQITLVNMTVEHSRTEVRELQVLHGDETRTVWHFAFLGWPDFGVPFGDDRLALLGLFKLSRYSLKDDIPRLVHCSAGCGRTGTFIALDYLLEELERGSFDGDLELDPIFETVDYLRKKRVMMVQNVAQFRFIYNTLHWRWNDKHGIGEDIGTNLDYTSVLGGPTRKMKKPRWQGVPQCMSTSAHIGIESLTKPIPEDENVSNGASISNSHVTSA